MRWRSERQTVPQTEAQHDDDGSSVGSIPRMDEDGQDNSSGSGDRANEPLGPSSALGSVSQDEDDMGGDSAQDDKPSSSQSSSPNAQQSSSSDDKNAKHNLIEEIDDDPGLDHSLPPDEAGASTTVWKPQNCQSTCEFTHTITNYAQKREGGCKKAEYSSTTVDDHGNRWRLIVYVNGNGRASNHHLSLFLQVADADDLPFGWKKAVSYVLTLEHPSGSNLGYAKRNPDKTFKLCPKAIDWGWSQFITSDRIQQEGYVTNDSLTVRASVTVKSSSVTIDPDDSELYLKCAVEEGNADAVQICLKQGAGVNCQFKDDLYTPLHTACSSSTISGSLEVLQLLLKRGADGNACNKWRETPLLIAANNGHRSAVEALLRSNADPSLCSEAGWSALTFAAHKGYEDIVALLLKAGAPVNCRVTEDLSTPLHKACAGGKPGHLSAVKQLLDSDADVHALNKWRETPLLTAANHGQAKAVEALLKAGADPCRCTDTGWSPLSIAAYKGHDDVVRLLLEEGAPTEEADPTLSALLQAATKGLPDTVELLLKHGADHTVTTKKGDTALSILVEQNLIDTAVDMVMDYKASIPRCSRDRKKVQRARLLINLRIKQQQREGLLSLSSDDETDIESEESNNALHDDSGSANASQPSKKSNNKKKGKSSRASAEAQARAAEEALLMELEQEDAKAQKDEAAAKKKGAKKKKKKERERQQKLKEEQAQREKEEKEAKERERIRKVQEEKERKEREKKAKEEREREMKEAAEREKQVARETAQREKQAAAMRKEKEAREKRELSEKKAAEKAGIASTPNEKRGAKAKATSKPTQHAQPAMPPHVPASPLPSKQTVGMKKRGWETKNTPATPPVMPAPSPARVDRSSPNILANSPRPREPDFSVESPRNIGIRNQPNLPQQESLASDFVTHQTGGIPASPNDRSVQGQMSPFPAPTEGTNGHHPGGTSTLSVELPAVSLYRQEKLSEILQRCNQARSQPNGSDPLGVVDEETLKTVICRWIFRASHDKDSFLDCMIPSWTDLDFLVAFFQRQFISESRKGVGPSGSAGMMSIEALKEAGSAVGLLCHSQAKDLVQISQKLAEQLPHDWTDSTLSFTASEATRNGLGPLVVIDWANRAQVSLPTATFAKLRDRYVGPRTRILASLFSAKMRYDLMGALASGTTMAYMLPASVQACMKREASVAAELWSDPISVLGDNTFFGRFHDIDFAYGGLPPFGKEESGGDTIILQRGASISVMAPPDNMVASLYVRNLVDVMDKADRGGLPISCVLILHSDCFRDLNRAPAINDLTMLDPRLTGHHGGYVRFAEVLPPGQHSFACGSIDGMSEVCRTASLFVIMQNETGKGHFQLGEIAVLNIIQSLGVSVLPAKDIPVVAPMGIPDNFGADEPPILPQAGYNDPISLSPRPQQVAQSDFGTIGGSSLTSAFSNDSRSHSRHGRFFDLVDDGEEDVPADMDVVSGMLSSLNLFQSTPSQDIDIEGLALTGFGGAPVGEGSSSSSFGFGATGSRTTSRFAD